MEIFEGHRALFRPLDRPALTIGNFDGVHLGHQALLAGARRAAGRIGGDAVAMTFEPHPKSLLAPSQLPLRLSSPSRKQELLAAAGMDVAIVESFDKDFAERSADDFTRRLLHEILKVQHVVVGHDFGYGCQRSGDVNSLRAAGEKLGFEVEVVTPVEVDGQRASSSAIRQALIAGQIDLAQLLLGRAYDVDGPVVRGAGRGRELGIPTANVDCAGVLLPKPGIYATSVQILGEPEHYLAATSLGTNPTFQSGGALTLEANLLDFDGDLYAGHLYNKVLRVAFLKRLRDEERYEDVDALLAQISKDIAATREVGQRVPQP